jgi:predicted RNA-binding Zn-ribbon protein involved in translation (DUF1610 family)
MSRERRLSVPRTGRAPVQERCAACGWTLTILRGHSTAQLFHPLRCPSCGSRAWIVATADHGRDSAA